MPVGGGGVDPVDARFQRVLFERIINAVVEAAPGIRFCFTRDHPGRAPASIRIHLNSRYAPTLNRLSGGRQGRALDTQPMHRASPNTL
jgi:hypothetical protein